MEAGDVCCVWRSAHLDSAYQVARSWLPAYEAMSLSHDGQKAVAFAFNLGMSHI